MHDDNIMNFPKKVKKRNGRLENFEPSKINRRAEKACKNLEGCNPSDLVLTANLQFQEKVSTEEIDRILILSAKTLSTTREPNYVFAAARIELDSLYKNIFKESVDSDTFEDEYRHAFKRNIIKLIKDGRLNPKLQTQFDLNKLAQTLDIEADDEFAIHGITVLKESYLLKNHAGKLMETPQAWLMRVAMGLAIDEDNPTERAIEFYKVFSERRGLNSTPTLFNSGTVHPQLSSCYLFDVHDSSKGIMAANSALAELSKFAGGLGGSLSGLRSSGSYIKSTAGNSSGPVPFAKIIESVVTAFNQGGKRKGVCCIYLEPWHLDVVSFLELRKNSGDERLRTHDLNTALWIPDEFMRRCQDPDADWTLLDPGEFPELQNLYGDDFKKRYEEIEELVKNGEVKLFKTMKARALWKKMLEMLIETGHPWINFKCPSNMSYPNKHVGAVHSSNLCTEIILRTEGWKDSLGLDNNGLVAVCNLASINLTKFISKDGKIDTSNLEKTVSTMVRMLDNVIDRNFYPVEAAERFNVQDRAIGLGMMGWRDACLAAGYSLDSSEAVELADKITEYIAYFATKASMELAKEKGKYPTFEGSLWSKGILPLDTYVERQKARGFEYNDSSVLEKEWNDLREEIKAYGLRNSNLLAIAPNATISNIFNVGASIEPIVRTVQVKENQYGTFFDYVPQAIEDLKNHNLWNNNISSQLAANGGDLSQVEGIPEEIKSKYVNAYSADWSKLIEAQGRRMKWVDQSISYNQFASGRSIKEVEQMYLTCWKRGLKTTYYLRTIAATKSSSLSSRTVVEEAVEAPQCRIDDPDCESCQ